MKARICQLIGCPRLVWAETQKGSPDFAKCNQQMPDEAPRWENCVAVSRERCRALRKALKQKREVQAYED